MAKIQITRSAEWVNNARRIGVWLDGQKIGNFYDKETKEFEVPEGQHKLYAKIDWCGSKEVFFTLNENETKNLTLSAFRYSRLLIGYSACLIALHFILKHTLKFDFLIWFLIPSFLVFIYYLTIGRNKYLIINER